MPSRQSELPSQEALWKPHITQQIWNMVSLLFLLLPLPYLFLHLYSGTGSDRRRKNLITGKFGSASLFTRHRHHCRESFGDIARLLQNNINEIVNQQVELVEADLNMVANENVMLESERDPEFRVRVGAAVESVLGELERIGRVFEDV
jgi:hypothetical protein